MLNLFDDSIANMISSRTFNPVEAELFIRGRKLSILIGVFFYTIILHSTKRCAAKLFALLYYENSKQDKASRNSI